jgi:hypothetical protein
MMDSFEMMESLMIDVDLSIRFLIALQLSQVMNKIERFLVLRD